MKFHDLGLIMRQCKDHWKVAIELTCAFHLACLGIHARDLVLLKHTDGDASDLVQVQDVHIR